jgi:mono/diheme cytochrome c family protein
MHLRNLGVSKLSALLILVILAGIFVACAKAGDNPSSVVQTMDGQALLESRCIQCHGVDRVTTTTKSPEAWRENVESMVQRGAKLNDQEKDVLVAYLAAEYGQ